MKLYEQFSCEIQHRIESGYYPPGNKLPSIREMSQTRGISISTVQEAYRMLEDMGFVISKPKSGYFVKQRYQEQRRLEISRPKQAPVEVKYWDEVLQVFSEKSRPGFVAFGRGTPSTHAPSLRPLQRIQIEVARECYHDSYANTGGKGDESLRKQIVRMVQASGCYLHHEDIQITTGCQEALALSLKAVTEKGDIVAIDSPSFYGSMQAIQSNGLKVIEIPTHPETGISLSALELALEQWPIKVVQLIPTSNNPIGYLMPDERKQRLLEMAEKYDFTIIEDDIYGDLVYDSVRPKTIKSLDTNGRVILCSSFSKTVVPGFRIGWIATDKYGERLMHLKFISSMASSSTPQLVLSRFIERGYYAKHVRIMRGEYQRNRDLLSNWVMRYFPDDTKLSRPSGGFSLWVELSANIDTVDLNHQLHEHGIGIAPGKLFSASGKYRNFMRLNYSMEMNESVRDAVRTMGEIIQQQAATNGR